MIGILLHTHLNSSRYAGTHSTRPSLTHTHIHTQAAPHEPDVLRGSHRAFLIERCKWAAALLFAPPGTAAAGDDPEPAARMLRTWSMPGLERLFADVSGHTVRLPQRRLATLASHLRYTVNTSSAATLPLI